MSLDYNSHASLLHLDLLQVDSKPIMSVVILGQKFPGLLDTGSTVSILGEQLFPLLHDRNVKLLPTDREFSLAAGRALAIGSVFINIIWPGGSKRHHFYLLERLNRPVLLGRDFITATNISLHMKAKGWTVGYDPQAIVPFDSDSADLMAHFSLNLENNFH